nr:MAG: hypothetical protein [Lokiarchaeota virus Skoll Meg22_1214]
MEEEIMDLSGHGAIPVEVDDLSDPSCLWSKANVLIWKIERDEKMRVLAKKKKIMLILPGHGTLAACVLAVFHGRFGYFPRIKWYHRKLSGGFMVSTKQLDLQEIRDQAEQDVNNFFS